MVGDESLGEELRLWPMGRRGKEKGRVRPLPRLGKLYDCIEVILKSLLCAMPIHGLTHFRFRLCPDKYHSSIVITPTMILSSAL